MTQFAHAFVSNEKHAEAKPILGWLRIPSNKAMNDAQAHKANMKSNGSLIFLKDEKAMYPLLLGIENI